MFLNYILILLQNEFIGNSKNLSSEQPNQNQHDFHWHTATKEISKSKTVKRKWSFRNKEAQLLKLYEQTDFLIVKKKKKKNLHED